MSYKSVEEQAKAIKKYYQASLKTKGEEKLKNERLFFEAFPNSFKNMQEVFGFDDDKGEAPLYSFIIGGKVIVFFSNLSSIDKDKYYNKYINICIDGVWEGDNIADGFGLYNKLYNFPEDVLKVLKQKTDYEIRSVLRFIFDGPHPKNVKESYERMYFKLKPIDAKIADLLKQEYNKLLTESKHWY
jgi:basic membrane lipoprotein Med (substrate-binding protein (PBP1-ABC) superfamily)